MNEEQLCDLHEHNETAGVDNRRFECAIDACLASNDQESDICKARDILEWAQEKLYKPTPKNRISRADRVADTRKALTRALKEIFNHLFCTH